MKRKSLLACSALLLLQMSASLHNASAGGAGGPGRNYINEQYEGAVSLTPLPDTGLRTTTLSITGNAAAKLFSSLSEKNTVTRTLDTANTTSDDPITHESLSAGNIACFHDSLVNQQDPSFRYDRYGCTTYLDLDSGQFKPVNGF